MKTLTNIAATILALFIIAISFITAPIYKAYKTVQAVNADFNAYVKREKAKQARLVSKKAR
jgi:uncharacterized membrane protein YwzB